ncbi:MAG TPA: phosphodiesterase [Candidatus Luteococcus avicola]|nr:phosphodiesterase [Candidatus Luteococcus avicola]
MIPDRLPADLRRDIDACGYFPEFVADSVALGLGDEDVVGHLVHHEANFANEAILRHLSVLVLTATRLLVVHTDEGPETDAAGRPTSGQAVTSCEAIPLQAINSVALSRVVASPERYGDGSQVVETWLTMGWGTMRRIDLEPAACADPTCEADHGYTGSLVGDDITIRMSPAADGADNVAKLVTFAAALQQVPGRR